MSVMGDARSKRYMIHENRLKYDVDEILFRTDGRKLFPLYTWDPQLNYMRSRQILPISGSKHCCLKILLSIKAQPTRGNVREACLY